MDAAAGEIEKLIKQYGVLIVLNLLDEIDELQEFRRSYLALRGEIEDVQAQLYEAENLNEADAAELQERRKADNAEPVFFIEVDPTCKYCGGTGYFRWQQSENMCPCPCVGCYFPAASKQEVNRG